MRPRFKVKAGLQGSSDFAHLMSRKVQLEAAHQKFITSKAFIALSQMPVAEPKPDQMVKIRVWGKPMVVPYHKAKSLNLNWEYV